MVFRFRVPTWFSSRSYIGRHTRHMLLFENFIESNLKSSYVFIIIIMPFVHLTIHIFIFIFIIIILYLCSYVFIGTFIHADCYSFIHRYTICSFMDDRFDRLLFLFAFSSFNANYFWYLFNNIFPKKFHVNVWYSSSNVLYLPSGVYLDFTAYVHVNRNLKRFRVNKTTLIAIFWHGRLFKQCHWYSCILFGDAFRGFRIGFADWMDWFWRGLFHRSDGVIWRRQSQC